MFRKLHDPDEKAPGLTVTIDGQTVSAEPGESVAAVLLRLDPPISRTTPVNGSPRTPYCMMGVCFECLANVDGVASVQTCLVQVRDGMCVERQHGRRVLMATMRDDAAADTVASRGHTTEGAPR
ncbi:(2Fe-2S)-binding protein [Paraburkholderia phymatum]|uniref:(2Fe-2S)-binding protein n=1 Tax=Paraburkholderia phymatum TaxID=148447 RepID=UPI00317966F6